MAGCLYPPHITPSRGCLPQSRRQRSRAGYSRPRCRRPPHPWTWRDMSRQAAGCGSRLMSVLLRPVEWGVVQGPKGPSAPVHDVGPPRQGHALEHAEQREAHVVKAWAVDVGAVGKGLRRQPAEGKQDAPSLGAARTLDASVSERPYCLVTRAAGARRTAKPCPKRPYAHRTGHVAGAPPRPAAKLPQVVGVLLQLARCIDACLHGGHRDNKSVWDWNWPTGGRT